MKIEVPKKKKIFPEEAFTFHREDLQKLSENPLVAEVISNWMSRREARRGKYRVLAEKHSF